MMSQEPTKLSVAYLAAPILAVVVALPAIASFPPFRPPAPDAPWWIYLAGVPSLAGIIACPGYVYAWVVHGRRLRPTLPVLVWLHLSLFLAAVASLLGTIFMLPTVLFCVPSALTLGLVVHLWMRLSKDMRTFQRRDPTAS